MPPRARKPARARSHHAGRPRTARGRASVAARVVTAPARRLGAGGVDGALGAPDGTTPPVSPSSWGERLAARASISRPYVAKSPAAESGLGQSEVLVRVADRAR